MTRHIPNAVWMAPRGMIEPRQAGGKNKGITRAQFNQLAFLHGRMSHATSSAADWATLLQRVAQDDNTGATRQSSARDHMKGVKMLWWLEA